MAFSAGRPPSGTGRTRGLSDSDTSPESLLLNDELAKMEHERKHEQHERWHRRLLALLRRR
jgi:hypothetical protein